MCRRSAAQREITSITLDSVVEDGIGMTNVDAPAGMYAVPTSA